MKKRDCVIHQGFLLFLIYFILNFSQVSTPQTDTKQGQDIFLGLLIPRYSIYFRRWPLPDPSLKTLSINTQNVGRRH